MIVVIQCAATKRQDAGYFQSESGNRILFVAAPAMAPASTVVTYAHPDEAAEDGRSWRQHVADYDKLSENPFGLFRACDLYTNPAYSQLVNRFGLDRVFILSAGWGLLRADFLTPQYDITFSAAAKRNAPWKVRRLPERYHDLNQLLSSTSEPIVFLGGKDYVGLFCSLTSHAQGERKIFYNSATPPRAPGCALERFDTSTRTNWHYECARRLVARV
jgi:hypothetical protein